MVSRILLRIYQSIYFHSNEFLIENPWLPNLFAMRFTVIDAFGTPGDTILTATVCRNLKQRFPRLSINCVTPNPNLLKYDPFISELNGLVSIPVVKFWYLGLLAEKSSTMHLLDETMHKVAIKNYDKNARMFLSDKELTQAKDFYCSHIGRPFITFNVNSRQRVKTWSTGSWEDFLKLFVDKFPNLSIVQLGSDDEPLFNEHVLRLAGRLEIRDSVAIQSLSHLHIGCVSFLMHSANAVKVPSVIIYGGRETPDNSGYDNNENIYVNMDCSPCWLHDSNGDICPHSLQCMIEITPIQVLSRVTKLLSCLDFI